MATNYHDITLALSGVCQSAKLVNELATQGNTDTLAFSTSIKSLLVTQPENTLAIFEDRAWNLRLGLQTLLSKLNSRPQDLTRYWISLLNLANKLERNPQAKQELAQRITRVPEQLKHYGLLEPQMLSNFAAMYTDIISPLGKKIQINGTLTYLQQPAIQDQIRACLLAGIRSAVLWQQVGGTKWQLLFSRRKLFNAAKQIFDSL